jgi:hypothetical protein
MPIANGRLIVSTFDLPNLVAWNPVAAKLVRNLLRHAMR